MEILIRITKRAWHYRTRIVLAYVTFFAAIAFSLFIPYLFGESIDRLITVEDGKVIPTDIERGTLIVLGLALLGASMMRGTFDFARTYTTDSLSQKVSYDLRNDMYDRLQHLSFGFHDTERSRPIEWCKSTSSC